MRRSSEIEPEEQKAYYRYIDSMTDEDWHKWHPLYKELSAAYEFEKQNPTQQLCTVARTLK